LTKKKGGPGKREMIKKGRAKEEKTYLWLITTKSPMTKSQPLQPNRELDITRPHDILYFEFRKFSIKS
jgi:hypothetical protein